MCLKIEQTFRRRHEARDFTKQPLIAKRAITTYKVLCLLLSDKSQELITPYRTARVIDGIVNTTGKFSFSVVDACGWRVNVNQGIHSFKNKEDAISLAKKIKCDDGIILVSECKIIKGSAYFKNKKEYASLLLYIPPLSITESKSKGINYLLENLSNKWEFVH